MHWVPKELATENIHEDLRNRIIAVRGADLFTRSYGASCRALLALDVPGQRNTTLPDLGEYEAVVRFIRRLSPEMRGIAYFNGSATDERVERLAHDLCFEYFIKPVVTLQPNSLWLREADGGLQVVAALSNIGGMDSGPVTVRFWVDDAPLETARAEVVPAGHSRLTNRVLLAVPWTPAGPGSHRLRAEITAASGSTVLDASVVTERFIGSP